MEGVYEPIVEAVAAPAPPRARRDALWPGYALTALVAALAYGVHFLPVQPFRVVRDATVRHPISAAILAILMGLLIRNLLPIPASVTAGCKRVIKKVIPLAIVLTGAGLNLVHVGSVGIPALVITMLCMGIAIGAAVYFGRMLGLGQKVAMLIGAGTGICGNSAIVAVAPLIDARDEDLVLSIGTVNLFGLVVMLVCPLLGGALHLGHEAFGIWAGTSIHAVPQVVAAGFALSPEAGSLATLVKLVRVTLLAPLVFVLALVYARNRATTGQSGRHVLVHYARLVPWFVWGFVVMATLGTLGLIPSLRFEPAGFLGGTGGEMTLSLVGLLTGAGKLLLTLAMAAIGLEVNVRLLAGVSTRAVLTGLVASAVLAAASLALIKLLL